MTFWPLTSYSDFPTDKTNFITLIPDLTFTELRVVSIEHLQRKWLASRERLPFRTLGSAPSPFGNLLMLQLLSPVLPNLPCLFSTIHLAYPSVLSRFYSFMFKTVTVCTNTWYWLTEKFILWRSIRTPKAVLWRWHHQDAWVSGRQHTGIRENHTKRQKRKRKPKAFQRV